MRVIVTGGSGYLGSHLTRHFGADDLSRRAGADIMSEEDARQVADHDLVIHLAARLDKAPESSEDVLRTNVEGTINLLRNVSENASFIFASTKDVYGRFADNYPEVPETCPTLYAGQTALEWSKLIAEHYVRFYAARKNFRSCILRLSTVYAPPSDGNIPSFPGAFAEAINRGESITLPGDGKPVRDLLHVDDLAFACEAFADSVIRHGHYNIGGGLANSLSLAGLVNKLEEISGLQAVIDKGSKIDAPPPNRYVSDLGRITQELGWKPSIHLDDGLKTLFGQH